GAGRRGAGLERALVRGKRPQLHVQLVQDLVGEAGADLAGVDELAGVVVADEQRAGIAAALALAFEPAADDELLSVAVLDVQPGAGAPPRFVPGVELLGPPAFEARLAACLEHRRPSALLERRGLPGGARQPQPGQRLAAVDVGLLRQRVSVLPEDVE